MIPEVSNPTAECPNPQLWNMHDDNSAEVEVLDFLRQLILTIKPNLVVETGTHLGWSAGVMGSALEDNGFGRLITCEISKELYDKACVNLGCVPRVKICNQSSLTLEGNETIDLLFCDSDKEIRMDEVEYFWPRLTKNSIILIHDVNTDCHKPLRDRVKAWGESGRLSHVFLPTPRGLAICQKR